VPPRASLESFDNQSGIGMGERGHLKLKLSITESAGDGGEFRRRGSAIDFCSDNRAIGGMTRLVANNNLQQCALPGEPSPGIDELQL
jgi:hypothetical protein